MSDETTHFSIPKPVPSPTVSIADEFFRLRLAWDIVDAALKAILDNANGRAPGDHTHTLEGIVGLVEALANKMAADATFKLDDLTDVEGAEGAAANYVLVKNSAGQWVPSTAIAALGSHGHTLAEITGLIDALNNIATALADKAAKTTTIGVGGLASGGGDLSANRTITVPKATDAEHQARQRDDVAATPKGVGLALAAYNKWKVLGTLDHSNLSAYFLTNLAAIRELRMSGSFWTPGATPGYPVLQFSADAGASWIGSAYEYMYWYGLNGASSSTYHSGRSSIPFLANENYISTWPASFEMRITELNKPQRTAIRCGSTQVIGSGTGVDSRMDGWHAVNMALNGFRFSTTQPMAAYAVIEGVEG